MELPFGSRRHSLNAQNTKQPNAIEHGNQNVTLSYTQFALDNEGVVPFVSDNTTYFKGGEFPFFFSSANKHNNKDNSNGRVIVSLQLNPLKSDYDFWVSVPFLPVNALTAPLIHDNDNETAPFGLNIMNLEEDVPFSFPIGLGDIQIIIDPPAVNEENCFFEFTDIKLWSDGRFPENEVRRKASCQVMLQTMKWLAMLLFCAFLGVFLSCKQDFDDRADNSDSCILEQEEEDLPDFLLIDHLTGNAEIPVIKFKSDKDAKLWCDNVCLKPSNK